MKLSKNKQRAPGILRGMTLVEMMISLSIGTLIILVALLLFQFSARTFSSLNNYDEFNRESRHTLDVMLSDIRQAKRLSGFTSNSVMQQLTFANIPGSAVSSFSYTYANNALSRTWGNTTTLMLTNVTSLSFVLSQRNPNNNFTFVASGSPTSTKLINVTWICTLPVYGTHLTNTESIQTANIVVRN